jgi:hypothetical protein
MLTNSSPNPRDAPWTNATPGAVACCALPPSTDAAVRTTPVWKKLEHKLLRDTISDDVLRRNARKKQALTHLEHTTAAIAIAIARAAVSLCASLFSRTLFCLSPRREPDETEGRDPFPTNDSVQSSPLIPHIVRKVRCRVFLCQNFVISVVGTSCWHPIKCYKKIRLKPRKRNFPQEWTSFSCNQLAVFYLHFCLNAKEFQNIQDFQHDMPSSKDVHTNV